MCEVEFLKSLQISDNKDKLIEVRLTLLESLGRPHSHEVVHFIDIFKYAEDVFGVERNLANNLFFRTEALTYKSYNEYEMCDIFEFFDCDVDVEDWDESDFTIECINKLEDYGKAHAIIGHYMHVNEIDTITIKND